MGWASQMTIADPPRPRRLLDRGSLWRGPLLKSTQSQVTRGHRCDATGVKVRSDGMRSAVYRDRDGTAHTGSGQNGRLH